MPVAEDSEHAQTNLEGEVRVRRASLGKSVEEVLGHAAKVASEAVELPIWTDFSVSEEVERVLDQLWMMPMTFAFSR